MNVSIVTLGCKVNQYESEAILERLLDAGFQAAGAKEPADVIIINSCTVTAASDHKVRQLLRRSRRENPEAAIVLTGCMPQAFPETAASLTEADIVLGNSRRADLLPRLLEFLSHHQRIVDIHTYGKGEPFEQMSVSSFHERTRAFIKIEDGCNRFCSYCIIPYSRGRVRSKPLQELQAEVNRLADAGYREVVLVGINLSAYGQELGLHLCDAVECCCAVDGIERVRLGSLEPEQMDKEVVKRLSQQKKLCPQFHLSLQSGCNATLRRMNRHYSSEEYAAIVENLRASFENAAITTDIMVGFAGESEKEFEESLAFAQTIGFAKAHVFAYSRRPGTRADSMPDQLPNAIKEERSRRMIAQTNQTRAAFLKTQVGRTETVLFESRCENGVYEGYTMNYTPVRVANGANLCGKLVSVTLTEAFDDYCVGSIL